MVEKLIRKSVYSSDFIRTEYQKEMIGTLLTVFMLENDFTEFIKDYELSYEAYILYFKEIFEMYGDENKVEYYKKEFGE